MVKVYGRERYCKGAGRPRDREMLYVSGVVVQRGTSCSRATSARIWQRRRNVCSSQRRTAISSLPVSKRDSHKHQRYGYGTHSSRCNERHNALRDRRGPTGKSWLLIFSTNISQHLLTFSINSWSFLQLLRMQSSLICRDRAVEAPSDAFCARQYDGIIPQYGDGVSCCEDLIQ